LFRRLSALAFGRHRAKLPSNVILFLERISLDWGIKVRERTISLYDYGIEFIQLQRSIGTPDSDKCLLKKNSYLFKVKTGNFCEKIFHFRISLK
jgi:hypothetical protein